MNPNDLAAAGDRNLAAAWSLLGRRAGSPSAELEGLTLTSTGLPIAFFNGAFVTATVADANATVEKIQRFYADRGVPYQLWARVAVGQDVLSAARRAGLRDAGNVPAMGLPSIGDIPPAPKELAVRFVKTMEELFVQRLVMSKGFEMPLSIAEQLMVPALLDESQIALVVGYVRDVPVVTAALIQFEQSAGVYNVATLPEHRGKGYGAAATWAVLAEAARRGCTHSVLQASSSGHPVYRRMGYQDLGDYVRLEGPPAA
jgi:GNAT superfamily N-acetyltransferase